MSAETRVPTSSNVGKVSESLVFSIRFFQIKNKMNK